MKITVLDPDTYYRKLVGFGFAVSEWLSKLESRVDAGITRLLGGREEKHS